MVTNALQRKNIFEGFADNLRYGAAGGFSAAVGKDLLIGMPKARTNEPRTVAALEKGKSTLNVNEDPLYRGGGFLDWIGVNGMALGRDVIVNETGRAEDDFYLWTHETAHFWQYSGYGFGKTFGHLGQEHLFGSNIYIKGGNYEWQANLISQWLGWLTYADHQPDTIDDRRYYYNYLGSRIKHYQDSTNEFNYIYSDTMGSSKLRWFTGMAADSMDYDILGNLISDLSRSLDSLTYDYRNLLDYSRLPEVLPDSGHPYLTFTYDESSRRIKKRFDYNYLAICGDPGDPGEPGEPENMIIMGGDPGGGGTYSCMKWTHTEEHYLYDNDGTLLAIFDRDNDCKQMYVNGPTGRMAVYHNNQDLYLYYFLNDHLGSMRVMVDMNGAVKEFINYHPFGGVIESWKSYDEPMTFTGKQRDNHSTFDYYYFGARYYDYRIGQFASIDKAAQTPGGFLYAGNNPLIIVDPDGNLFFLASPFLTAALFGSISYIAENPFNNEFNFGKMLLHGLVGGFGGTLSTWGHANLWALNTIEGAAQGVLITGLHNTIDKKPFFSNESIISGIIGAVHGLRTSEHYKNWRKNYGWQSYDDVIKEYIETGQYADAVEYVNEMYGTSIDPKIIKGLNLQKDYRAHTDFILHPDGTTETTMYLGKGTVDLQGGHFVYNKNTFASTIIHEQYHIDHFNRLGYSAFTNISTKQIEYEAFAHEFKNINITRFPKFEYNVARNTMLKKLSFNAPTFGPLNPWIFSKRFNNYNVFYIF